MVSLNSDHSNFIHTPHRTITMPKYRATWDSLSQYSMPTWLREAKFGIYTHWGPYTVPAYGSNGTWYGKHMYCPDQPEYRHHLKNYGESQKFGYKDLIPQLTAEKFDAEEWAQLFKDAGAKFAGPVAVHHDNFAMWDSAVNPWNSSKMGPKRDVTRELEKAIKGMDMKFITTFHHNYNWWFFPKDEAFDTLDPASEVLYSRRKKDGDLPDEKYLRDWYDQIIEVIDNYDPDMLWFDFGLGKIPERYRKNFLAYYYNKAEESGKDVTVAFKNFNLSANTGLFDLEVGKMNNLTPNTWLSDTCVDAGPRGCWSHVRGIGYKSSERLIHNLIDRVSKNGYLLLNVGPRADGSIPQPAQDCLLEMGKWLAINGEAIYGTVPWLYFGEGPTKSDGGSHFNEDNEPRFTSHDLRYTTSGDNVYVTALGRPGELLTCSKLAACNQLHPSDILKVDMLGGDGNSLKFWIDEDGLKIEVPEVVPSTIAVSFRITTRSGL
jgi:alpha-L-fucosidase